MPPTATGIITVFNLIWWSLRILGLRPFLLHFDRGRRRHTKGRAKAHQQRSAEAGYQPLSKEHTCPTRTEASTARSRL